MASWALVLGASSGFGAAILRGMATEGRPVCGVHLDRGAARARADALASELSALGGPVHMHNANAARAEARTRILDDLQTRMGEGDDVGVLVHALAFGSLRELVPQRGDALEPRQVTMTSEVMGHSLAWWVQDLVQRGMLVEGGRVLALTSVGARRAWPSYGAVSAAKAALEAWVRQCALELAPRGIAVNAIQPGVCPTPSLTRIPGHDALLERARGSNPSGRLTTPEDVARCAVALCQPGLEWMTGNIIRVDGGEHLV